MKLKKIIATSLTMAMAFTLAPIAVPNQSKAATATITLSGSTSISPLAQQLAKQYHTAVSSILYIHLLINFFQLFVNV